MFPTNVSTPILIVLSNEGYRLVKSISTKLKYKPGTGSNKYPPLYPSFFFTVFIFLIKYLPANVFTVICSLFISCMYPSIVGVPLWWTIWSPSNKSLINGFVVVGLLGAIIFFLFKLRS